MFCLFKYIGSIHHSTYGWVGGSSNELFFLNPYSIKKLVKIGKYYLGGSKKPQRMPA